ncbi:MAG: hypothetical protein E6868_19435 [Pantoea sp.]|uniref:hypothetical protein n=1 Tax=Pantoea sp. TaxID=69393 RepID=UPI0029008688|nr:hypothetical protein [Pantoea sp.]MDU1575412.1 hypothetical protein [Pantoea sp.]
MSNKVGPLHIVICDDGYRLLTDSGDASYTLNGIPTLKVGIVDNLPDKLIITDRRSLPFAINVSAASTLWGAKVEWEWPKQADNSWYATVRSEYSEGEETNYQAGKTKFPESTYQVTGVPAGKNINLQVTLHDGNGKRSRPIQLSAKSSDDATAIVCDTFKIIDEHGFINETFINKDMIGFYRQTQVGSYHSNNGEVRYCDGNGGQRLRVQVGVIAEKATTADKIRDIVSKYLYGQASEYEDELVAELKALIEKETDSTRLATLISEQVRQRIKVESQPGGLLHKR